MSDDPLKPPTGSGRPGTRLWAAVVNKSILTPAELAMLAGAAHTADEVDWLERVGRPLPELVTTGSAGQLRAHPLLGEVRAHRQLLERLTTALNLPDDSEKFGTRGSSQHARVAAQARWRKKGERGGDAQEASGRADARLIADAPTVRELHR